MIVYYSVTQGVSVVLLATTVIGSLIAGLIFASLMHYTAPRLSKTVMLTTEADEIIIKEAGANHFLGKEGVGGKLLLTSKRLVSKSHKVNIQNHQVDFDFNDIRVLHQAKVFKLFNTQLEIKLTDKSIQTFVVEETY